MKVVAVYEEHEFQERRRTVKAGKMRQGTGKASEFKNRKYLIKLFKRLKLNQQNLIIEDFNFKVINPKSIINIQK